MKHEKPLWQRLYFDPVYYETVRAVGYLGCLYRDLWERLKPVTEQFGQRAVESATAHLLTYEGQFTCNPKPLAQVMLRTEVRNMSWQLLGPPPEKWDEFYEHTANRPPNPYAKAEEPKAEKPKRSRKKKVL
jgi:hypothetical protein